MSRPALVILLMLPAGSSVPSGEVQTAPDTSSDLRRNIASLAALDFPVRMHAARLIRRTPGNQAVPALAEAVRHDSDEFVRYRALVLLTAFNDPGTPDLMREMMRDRNDRVREVAYKWFETRPDARMAAPLVALLASEESEFVRPALVGALAALGNEPVVQRPMIVETARGLDFFRSAVIESLGRHRAAFALDAIVNLSRIEGPLQDDGVLAIGRIGGPDAAAILDELTKLRPEAAVVSRGARCLIGQSCADHLAALVSIAASPETRMSEVRAAIGALSAVAQSRSAPALAALVGLASRGAVRERVAVAVAGVALREPEWTVKWMSAVDDAAREDVMVLMKDGFDSVEEDFAEERFFAAVRAGYWRADEGSAERALAAALIQRLEF